MTDERWMRHALSLAERGRGAVEPNPMVGAVVLDAGGAVAGEGWHRRFGEAHAEVNALAAAGERARGGTLYVTLEPCCHHGKTPPCTDAVLRAGVRRVVAAMTDPFPKVAGGGLAVLRAAGFEVTVGVCDAEARELNAPYLTLLSAGRPWVLAKWAMTLDGRIATRTGDSRWISNEESRRIAHDIRGRVDAVLVGRGTVTADDPLLTARPPGPRTAARVVVTASGRLPERCRLRDTARDVPVIVFTAVGNVASLAGWAAGGCEVVGLPAADTGLSIADVLADLGRRRMTNVLVEGGAGLLGSVLDVGLADELHVFVGPAVVGGPGLSPVGGAGVARLADAARLVSPAVRAVGGDVYISGRVSAVGRRL
jgi:diaminohydroxyphosphoribosylaminopyrimidine deaminase/5-amino-6-(5-phosphoribosylamino)uracil reductase